MPVVISILCRYLINISTHPINCYIILTMGTLTCHMEDYISVAAANGLAPHGAKPFATATLTDKKTYIPFLIHQRKQRSDHGCWWYFRHVICVRLSVAIARCAVVMCQLSHVPRWYGLQHHGFMGWVEAEVINSWSLESFRRGKKRNKLPFPVIYIMHSWNVP